LLVALAIGSVGCVYPRRETALSPVARIVGLANPPAHVYRLTIVRARVGPLQRGGLPWDDDGSTGPDVYVRVLRDGEVVLRTETLANEFEPEWNVTTERNVYLPPSAELRIEVWDEDVFGGDPVGIYNNRGLPLNAQPGADASIFLDTDSVLTLRVERPQAHRGVGIAEYEVRPESLAIVRVLTHSPAGRAGLEPGDEIVAIGEEQIADLGAGEAASALSLAQTRQVPLTVRRAGEEREVVLDRDYVWLAD
jgi:hypothetical protein